VPEGYAWDPTAGVAAGVAAGGAARAALPPADPRILQVALDFQQGDRLPWKLQFRVRGGGGKRSSDSSG